MAMTRPWRGPVSEGRHSGDPCDRGAPRAPCLGAPIGLAVSRCGLVTPRHRRELPVARDQHRHLGWLAKYPAVRRLLAAEPDGPKGCVIESRQRCGGHNPSCGFEVARRGRGAVERNLLLEDDSSQGREPLGTTPQMRGPVCSDECFKTGINRAQVGDGTTRAGGCQERQRPLHRLGGQTTEKARPTIRLRSMAPKRRESLLEFRLSPMTK